METTANAFVRKFSSAQGYLGSKSIHNIVSLKYRDNVGYSAYHELVDGFLNKAMNFRTEEIQGDFQGRAWLVTDKSGNQVVLIEHETGLEILYSSGSMASLLSLVPSVGSAWHKIRNISFRRSFDPDRSVILEKRILNSSNQIVEQHVTSFELYILVEGLNEFAAMERRVSHLEQQVAKLGPKRRARANPKKRTARVKK